MSDVKIDNKHGTALHKAKCRRVADCLTEQQALASDVATAASRDRIAAAGERNAVRRARRAAKRA